MIATSPSVEVLPVAGALGAEICGVDLAQPLDDETFAAVSGALVAHHVLFFRDQKLTPHSQTAFARRFGELDIHPIAEALPDHPHVLRVHKPAGESASFGVGWHSDNTFLPKPSMASILYGETIPQYGGDTLFASMERAYDALSPRMREILAHMTAVHSASRAYDPGVTGSAKYDGEAAIKYKHSDVIAREVHHPIVRTHPTSGRKCIFVNQMFTLRIEDLEPAESDALLRFLFEHCARPEFTCRFRWQPGSVAMWDNRCVQHYALDDYTDFERVMYRVTISGDCPV